MTTKPRIPAFGYVRVSSKGQEKGHGPERQRDDIGEYADKNGYIIEKFFEDAHTGTEADRPEMIKMLESILGNGVRTIIVASLDRFARDLGVQGALLARLCNDNITLISASTGDDITESWMGDPMRRCMVQVMGAFSELDKRLLVRKLKSARQAARKKGIREGTKPFGQRPGEEEALKELLRLSKVKKPPFPPQKNGDVTPKAMTMHEIAVTLNVAGLKPRKTKKWTAKGVWKVLQTYRRRKAEKS